MLGDLGQILSVLGGVGLFQVVLQAANHIHDVVVMKHDLQYIKEREKEREREREMQFNNNLLHIYNVHVHVHLYVHTIPH